MKFANATKLDRKSGGAQWNDLRFLFLIQEDATPGTSCTLLFSKHRS
jgi:hypothetical protein